MSSWAVNWNKIYRPLDLMSGISLVAMTGLTTADVICRYLGHPILGTYEIVGVLGALVYAGALPSTTERRSHVSVVLFLQMLPSKAKTCVSAFTISLSVILFGLIVWQSVEAGIEIGKAGRVLSALNLPFHYVVYLIGFAALFVCVNLLRQLVNLLRGSVQDQGLSKDSKTKTQEI